MTTQLHQSEKRVCANPPCTADLDGMRPSARYCSPACKTAHYRERKEKRAQRATVTSRTRKESGLQYSRRRALSAFAHWMGGGEPEAIDWLIAEEVLDPALSPLQRARLEQRSKEAANG